MLRFLSRGAPGAFALGLFLGPDPALAQGANPGEIAEIRRDCRMDYMRHCSDVPPGGQPAFACLVRNEAQLSSACRQAVETVRARQPGAAPPASGGTGR